MGNSFGVGRSLFSAILVLGFGSLVHAQDPIPQGLVAELPAILKAGSPKEMASDSELQKLMKARYSAAMSTTLTRWLEYRRAVGHLDHLLNAGRRLLSAGLDVNDTLEKKREFIGEMAEFSSKLELVMRQQLKRDHHDLDPLHEFRLEVAIERERLDQAIKSKAKTSK